MREKNLREYQAQPLPQTGFSSGPARRKLSFVLDNDILGGHYVSTRLVSEASEKDLQELYFRHPYLIEPRFEQCQLDQFYSLPSGFADLVLFPDPGIVVVELKIDSLRKPHMLQLAQYVREVQSRFPSQSVEAIFVGRSRQT